MGESNSPGIYGQLHLGRGTFGQAIEAAKNGNLVSRSGWNGKGMFVFIRPSDVLRSDQLPNIKSLPQSVKNWYAKNGNPTGEAFGISFTSYFCMKAADNSIVNGWLASQTDMTAEDWGIVSE